MTTPSGSSNNSNNSSNSSTIASPSQALERAAERRQRREEERSVRPRPPPPVAASPPPTEAAAAPDSPSQQQQPLDLESLKQRLPRVSQPTIRNTAREMLLRALADENFTPKDIVDVAVDVENELFKRLGDSKDYRTKLRSLCFNVKANISVRCGLLQKDVSASRLCEMSSQELATDTIKKEIDAGLSKLNHFQVFERSSEQGTTMFRCGKCGKRNTQYRQAQTRSADEPMTTFVTCLECNHHWKFC